MDATDRAFHDSIKPRWSADGTLVYPGPSDGRSISRRSRTTHDRDSLLVVQKRNLVSEAGDIRFAQFSSEV
jgi:nuclear pore complex protein Nup98-Nup96